MKEFYLIVIDLYLDFENLIVKFTQHHLLSKIVISATNSVTEMNSPMLQHVKFEC